MSIIAAGTTTTTALSSTGNTDGTLQFQVNGTTPSVTLNTLGAIGVGSTPGYGTSGQVLISGGSTAAPTWGTAGTATTATNLAGGSNGTIPYQSASGTTQMLAVGTSGQVLTSSGAGAPTWSTISAGVANNVVVVNTFNGYGSTNTAISTYTTISTNTGTAITYSSSASLGDSFTINEAGYYLVYTVASVASSVAFGASINSNQLSTAISSITFANRVIAAGGSGSSSFAPYSVASTIIRCAVGDVIRPHCSPGYGQNGTDRDVFIVRKVGNV